MAIIIISLFLYNIGIILTKRKKYRLKLPNKIKVFNLGSSHGYFAFNYENVKNGANLAQISQTFYYDYILLETFFNRIEDEATCFIPISYFSFSNKIKTWRKDDMINYYKILPLKKFKGREKIICFIFRYLPIIWSLKKKLDKSKEKTRIEPKKRILKQVNMLKDKRTNISIKYFYKIIKKLKDKNIRIILITTPFQKEYNKYFSEKLLNDKFYREIELIKRKENLEYYDLSKTYKIFDKGEYFGDNDHLNKKGSKIFMKEINKILNKEIKC